MGQTQEPPQQHQNQIPQVVRIRMITTMPDSGEEDDIIMDSTDGEGIPLQIGENPNYVEDETSPPLDWNNGDGPPPDYTTQDEGYEPAEYGEEYPSGTYDQGGEQGYEREHTESDSRVLVVASPFGTVESRGPGYG